MSGIRTGDEESSCGVVSHGRALFAALEGPPYLGKLGSTVKMYAPQVIPALRRRGLWSEPIDAHF
jgi:hypothetical protein